jgi:hypothetical protein
VKPDQLTPFGGAGFIGPKVEPEVNDNTREEPLMTFVSLATMFVKLRSPLVWLEYVAVDVVVVVVITAYIPK